MPNLSQISKGIYFMLGAAGLKKNKNSIGAFRTSAFKDIMIEGSRMQQKPSNLRIPFFIRPSSKYRVPLNQCSQARFPLHKAFAVDAH